MRTQGGYRFSLQFAADTEEQKRAGEFLERMGNRKSAIIVEALMTYLDANPKYESADIHIKVQSHSSLNREEIETLIRSIIEEKMKCGVLPASNSVDQSVMKSTLEDDITSMLSNLSMFG